MLDLEDSLLSLIVYHVGTVPWLPCLLSYIWASAWDFQQFDILTSVDSDKPLQPPFRLRNSKWCSVSSLTIIVYSSDQQRLWSDCAYAQADLRLCWSHIPHCWKSHALAHIGCMIKKTVNSRIILTVSTYTLQKPRRDCTNLSAQSYLTRIKFQILFSKRLWCKYFSVVWSTAPGQILGTESLLWPHLSLDGAVSVW